jgi:hypothetical protein
MIHRIHDQLKDLGIRDVPSETGAIRNHLRRIEEYRDVLWQLTEHDEVVRLVRDTVSSELSRKLEHIITPPKAVGLAEEVSLDSIKWFVEYWWRAGKGYSPDLYVASDNTVVASWREDRHAIQVRFFSSGFALASVKHDEADREQKSYLRMPVRELPSSFVS